MGWFSRDELQQTWQRQLGSPGMLRRDLQRLLPALRHLDPAAKLRLNGERIDWNQAQQWAWLPARWGNSWSLIAKKWQLIITIHDDQTCDLELTLPESWLTELDSL